MSFQKIEILNKVNLNIILIFIFLLVLAIDGIMHRCLRNPKSNRIFPKINSTNLPSTSLYK